LKRIMDCSAFTLTWATEQMNTQIINGVWLALIKLLHVVFKILGHSACTSFSMLLHKILRQSCWMSKVCVWACPWNCMFACIVWWQQHSSIVVHWHVIQRFVVL
jgi:hypothetical protein